MKSFTYNDISSDNLGLIIQDMPTIPRSQKDIKSIQIEGRNGNLHIDNGSYLSKDYTIKCICIDKSKIDDICYFLQGTHKLELSMYSDRYFNATIKNAINFSNYLKYLDSFPLIFELDPFAISKEEYIETLDSSGIINVGGTIDTYPIITVIGTGNITINGYNIMLTESNITINSELMQCYNGTIAKNDKVILNEFPILKVGDNNIVLNEGIIQVIIKYRRRWL